MATETGRDLAAALAELLRVPAESVTFNGLQAVAFVGECMATLREYRDGRHRKRNRFCVQMTWQNISATGYGPSPDEAFADARHDSARLAAATARVRAALGAEADGWPEGPPSEDGTYAAEAETDGELHWIPVQRINGRVWFGERCVGGWDALPIVGGKAPRYRRLDLPAPPRREP